MQELHKFPLDKTEVDIVPYPVMPRNEGKKSILVGRKHHDWLRYMSKTARPRVTLLALVEALIEEAYQRQRKREKAARQET